MTGKLVVLRGQRPGQEFHLLNNRAVLGRAEHADIVINDRAASRQHLEIVRDAQGFLVRDLTSGNGTFLNGDRIQEGELVSGDRIKIGSHELNFLQLSGAQRNPQQRRIVPHQGSPAAAPAVSAMAPAVAAPQGQVVVGHGVRVNAPQQVAPVPMAPGALPRQTGKKRMSPVAIVGILLFVVVALALVAVIGVQLVKRNQTVEPTATETAADLIARGDTALASHSFAEAREHFGAALQAAPDNEEAADGLERTTIEERMHSLLQEAEQRIAEKEYTAAMVTLRDIAQGSTLLSNTAANRLNTLVDEIVIEGRAKVDANDIAGAETLVRLALETNPGHASAAALRTEIGEIRARQEAAAAVVEVAVAAETPSNDREEPRATDRGTGRSERDTSDGRRDDEDDGGSTREQISRRDEEAEPDRTPVDDRDTNPSNRSSDDDGDSFARGWRYYDSGRFDSAVSFFERQAERLSGEQAEDAATNAGRISEFEDAYEMGKTSYDASEYDLAVHDLRRAYSLDRRLNSHYRDEIRGMLAQSHYELASQEYDRGRYKESGENARIALRYEEDHSETRRLVRRLEDHANEMYIEAVSYRESNPARARQICRDIMDMLPDSSSLRGRAEDLSNSL